MTRIGKAKATEQEPVRKSLRLCGCESQISPPLCFAARINGPSTKACELGRVVVELAHWYRNANNSDVTSVSVRLGD
jgi:hypothetical protein